MERLMLLEQTTPNDNFDSGLLADGGATPGGVIGRGSRCPEEEEGAIVKGFVALSCERFSTSLQRTQDGRFEPPCPDSVCSSTVGTRSSQRG